MQRITTPQYQKAKTYLQGSLPLPDISELTGIPKPKLEKIKAGAALAEINGIVDKRRYQKKKIREYDMADPKERRRFRDARDKAAKRAKLWETPPEDLPEWHKDYRPAA